MSYIVVDRRFEQAADIEALQAQENAEADCLRTNEVRFFRTVLALDRTRMSCIYTAPDCEAVRITQRAARLPFDNIWPAENFCETLGIPFGEVPAGHTLIAVDRSFPEPVSVEILAQGGEQGRWCFEANGVKAIDSYVRSDGMASLCLFAAPDIEAIRNSLRTLGSPMDRAWHCEIVRPG